MLILYVAMLDNENDKAGLEAIYEKNKTDMLRFAMSITGNKEMAEDAVHDAFITIIKNREKLFSLTEKEIKTRVILITKCRCIDLLRKNNKFSDDSVEDALYFEESENKPVEEKLILIDEYNEIKRHIASLDEASKLVLEMKYILGMSYKEIGKEMGITDKHVDTKIMRAKAKVRKLIALGGVHSD